MPARLRCKLCTSTSSCGATCRGSDDIRPLHPQGHVVSVNHVHGFGRFNLQNTSRRGGTRRYGSADHLVGLEFEYIATATLPKMILREPYCLRPMPAYFQEATLQTPPSQTCSRLEQIILRRPPRWRSEP